jgi:hypothetical protein
MAQTKPERSRPEPRFPSPMQPEMQGVTSVRQFFAVLTGRSRRKKPDKRP